MTRRSFMLEVAECEECPYYVGFTDTCDYEGDTKEIIRASDGGLPDNCPIYSEGIEYVKSSTHPPELKNDAPKNSSDKNPFRWG